MLNDFHKHRMELFACEATKDFAQRVVDAMNRMKSPEEPAVALGPLEVSRFSDGEFQPSFSSSVRGATCFIIQSTFPPSDNLMELLLTIDAAKRASANKVIAVMPYFGWARQDRKDRPRVSIGAKVVANMLAAVGTDSMMVCDLHADQIQGFFDIPVNHLYASNDFLGILKKLRDKNPKSFTIAAPDMGGAKRANAYAKYLHCPVVICHKTRARGANSVRAFATHAVLSGPAYERIASSALTEVYVTDTIPLSTDPEKVKHQGKIRVVSLAETFARMILKVYNYEPISDEFPL